MASDLRTKVLTATLAILEGEKAPIEQKITLGKYLTAEERQRHEFLAYAIGVLKKK